MIIVDEESTDKIWSTIAEVYLWVATVIIVLLVIGNTFSIFISESTVKMPLLLRGYQTQSTVSSYFITSLN